jgi:hypothetical protein
LHLRLIASIEDDEPDLLLLKLSSHLKRIQDAATCRPGTLTEAPSLPQEELQGAASSLRISW